MARRLRALGDCPACGHPWGEHGFGNDIDGMCGECAYEFEHAQVPESEAWSKARASNPWTRRMSPNLRHDVGSPGVYRRIFPK